MKTYIKLFIAVAILGSLTLSCKDSSMSKTPEKIAKQQNKANIKNSPSNGIHSQNNQKVENADILVEVIGDLLYQVELAKIGQQKSKNTKITKYSSQLEKNYNDELEKFDALAMQYNYTVPTSLSSSQWKTLKDLQDTKTTNFDQKWIKEVISQHNSAANTLVNGLKNTDQASIKNQLNTTLQLIRTNLESAQYIQVNDLK